MYLRVHCVRLRVWARTNAVPLLAARSPHHSSFTRCLVLLPSTNDQVQTMHQPKYRLGTARFMTK